ncbi:MAG: cold shock domain-containing protein [Candidatus Woesearchaeota archaeon]
MKGKVKFFNEMKGFGFIAGDDGNEYFVHQTGLKEGTRLKENDEVTFDGSEGDRGLKAENVELSTGGSSEETQEEPAEEEASGDAGEEEAQEEPAEEKEE